MSINVDLCAEGWIYKIEVSRMFSIDSSYFCWHIFIIRSSYLVNWGKEENLGGNTFMLVLSSCLSGCAKSLILITVISVSWKTCIRSWQVYSATVTALLTSFSSLFLKCLKSSCHFSVWKLGFSQIYSY